MFNFLAVETVLYRLIAQYPEWSDMLEYSSRRDTIPYIHKENIRGGGKGFMSSLNICPEFKFRKK
jgi:hypothetical protein